MWRELVSSGRISCCLSLVLRSFCFVLFRFRFFFLSRKPRPFVQSFFVLRYACAPSASPSYHLFLLRCRFFGVFSYHYRFFFVCCRSYVFYFRMVFFYLVTTGRIFYISLCENSINLNRMGVDTVIPPLDSKHLAREGVRRIQRRESPNKDTFCCKR